MELERIICPLCGSKELKQDGDVFYCPSCGNKFQKKFVETEADLNKQLSEKFDEHDFKMYSNAKQNLWQQTHKEYLSNDEIKTYLQEVKKYNPDDFLANFYELTLNQNIASLIKFILQVDSENVYADEVVRFTVKTMESVRLAQPVKALIEGLKNNGKFDAKEYTEYMSAVEKTINDLDNGVFDLDVPRDVFVAYSSKDIRQVNEVIDFLEDNGYTCFTAIRNLRHGLGAQENYQESLNKAMRNSKCMVFISSENSRDNACDAMKIELPYYKTLDNKGRIEYLIEEYGENTKFAARAKLKDFFRSLEYCRTIEDLALRVDEIRFNNVINVEKPKQQEISVKYCAKCGAENPTNIKFCGECGNNSFFNTKDEYYENRIKQLEKPVEQSTFLQPVVKPVQHITNSDFEIENGILKNYKGKGGNVVIPDTVKEIGENSFENCSSLNSIVIPNSVTSIGERAFCGCNGLNSIVIPDSVTYIGNNAFRGCSSLSSIEIGNSVTSIGEWTFYDCNSLSNITIDSGNKKYHSKDNCIIETKTNTLVLGCKNSIIPDYVTSIGDNAFSACSSLSRIEYNGTKTQWSTIKQDQNSIPKNCVIKYLDDKPVEQTKPVQPVVKPVIKPVAPINLADFVIVNNVLIKYKGEGGNVVIPDTVKEISTNVFWDCSSLNSIVIPNSVTSIGERAFCGCNGLNSIVIPDSVTYIGNKAFSSCRSLSSIEIGNSVTSIGDSAFGSCSSLSSIVLPKSVTFIDSYAFYFCSSLNSIAIPNSVTSIGDGAFFYCSSLTSINYNGTVAQWRAITKGSCWEYEVSSTCKVICTDGTISV